MSTSVRVPAVPLSSVAPVVYAPRYLRQASMALVVGGAMLIAQALIAGAVHAQRPPRAERDSIAAHATAAGLLRMFDRRYGILVRVPGSLYMPTTFPITGVCEISIADYCYGPNNGGLTYGGIGTYAAARALMPTRLLKSYHKRSKTLIDLYLGDLKRERRRIPGDRWLNGEIVRVEVERGNMIDANESIDGCKAEAWWCGALRGYVAHMSGVRRRADSIWTTVLPLMPAEERCAWIDPTWVIDDETFREVYAAASCEDRERLAARAWWLADPLFSISGNERRSEHLARAVEVILYYGYRQHSAMTPAMALAEKAPPPGQVMLPSPLSKTLLMELTYPDDPEQLVSPVQGVRTQFGYSELVMRVGPPMFTATEDEGERVIALYERDRLAFLPSGTALLEPTRAREDDWHVSDKRSFEFVSGWDREYRDLPNQISWFRRAGQSRVIAAADVGADSLLRNIRVSATLIFQKDYDQPAAIFEQEGTNVLVLDVRAESDSTLTSFEILDRTGVIARTRYGSGPPPMPTQRLSMSDLMLTYGHEPPPQSLEDAVTQARGSAVLAPGQNVGLFWEMYGLRPGETPGIAVTVSKHPPGLLGRVLGFVAGTGPDSLLVKWVESAVEGREMEPRAVTLDLRSLSAGRYTLALTSTLDGELPVTARRVIEIRESPRFQDR